MTDWTLRNASEVVVASLRVTGGDFPWLHGEIRELDGFGPWRKAAELTDELGLSLVDDEGEAVAGFWIVRHEGNSVGWRFY